MKKNYLRYILLAIVGALLVSGAFAATVTVRPDGQGSRSAWNNVGCSSGSSEWQCVDEDPAGTSDYLYTTGTSRETFTFSDTILSNQTINFVRLFFYGMQHNSASNSCFAAMTRSGSTEYLSGTQLCVSSSWVYRNYTYSTNPSTGSAWTVSDVNSLEAGMYGLNPNGGGRVAQVYATVDYTSVCGDDYKDSDEVCDGTDLNGQTCALLGFDGGTLGCNVDCQAFDTSDCYDNTCSDSDGGFNTITQGSASGGFGGNPYNNTDVCLDSTNLKEYYCVGNFVFNATYNCAINSSSCSGGACV